MKIGKYLKFHFKCLKEGRMPSGGLCNCFEFDKRMELFKPSTEEKMKLILNKESFIFWAKDNDRDSMFTYSSHRQTIVLFMAAMNDEL